MTETLASTPTLAPTSFLFSLGLGLRQPTRGQRSGLGCRGLSITPQDPSTARGGVAVSQGLLLCGAVTKGADAHLCSKSPLLAADLVS